MTDRTCDKATKTLRDDLSNLSGVELEFETKGACQFRVCPVGQKGRHKSFLRVCIPRDDSYVRWYGQGENLEACRTVFSQVVRNSTNQDGSKLIAGITDADILRLVKKYVVVASS